MKEITRIHLSRTAYDIELDAKRELERYIAALAKQTDEDVMLDIEARMVELLGERGIAAGGVIVKADIDAIKVQLGEPRDFVDETDHRTTEEVSDDTESWQDRRLYRDMDNALLGGVLAGIAAYFRIDPVIVRIIFVIIAISSFGWALVVYAILWFLIPPAVSAGQKLQLQGKPITALTIREFSEREFTNERLLAVRRFLSICVGIGAAVAATGALFATVAIFMQSVRNGAALVDNTLVTTLLILGGTFASWMFIALSSMFIRQDFSPSQANKIAVLFVLGILTGGGVIIWRIMGGMINIF